MTMWLSFLSRIFPSESRILSDPAIQPIQETTQFMGSPVEITRKSYSRQLKMFVKPEGKIEIQAPRQAPLPQIEKFLEANKDWIERQRNKLSDYTPAQKFSFGDQEKILFLGAFREVKKVPTLLAKIFFSIHDNVLNLHIPEKRSSPISLLELRRAIFEFYKLQAQILIKNRVEFFSREMKLTPSRLSFRGQKTRWGSCNRKGAISINWKLIMAPAWVIDSVVIHELAHLKHLNHSKDFWRLVETFDPETKRADCWLSKNYFALQIQEK